MCLWTSETACGDYCYKCERRKDIRVNQQYYTVEAKPIWFDENCSEDVDKEIKDKRILICGAHFTPDNDDRSTSHI